jgi:hypothetical protein
MAIRFLALLPMLLVAVVALILPSKNRKKRPCFLDVSIIYNSSLILKLRASAIPCFILNYQNVFIQLTDYFKKTKFAINIKAIKTIVEYDTGTKIECIKEDGSFLKHYYTSENLSQVCDIINDVCDKNNGKVTLYFKESLFK